MPLFSNFLQEQRLKVISPYIRADVLDLGCNNANIVNLLQAHQHYVGVERDSAIIQWLKQNRSQYEFYQRDFDKDLLALDNSKFDTIVMTAVVEHLKNPTKILQQIPQYLKPNGKLLITTPTPWGDKIHRIGARLGLFYMSAVKEHETIFTYSMLKELLTQSGLNITRYKKFLWGSNQLFICEAPK